MIVCGLPGVSLADLFSNDRVIALDIVQVRLI